MNYRQGLAALEQVAAGGDAEARRDIALYKAQLLENLRSEERFGTTETLRSDRARIVDKLNPLALQLAGVSFTDLCLGVVPKAPPPTADPPPAILPPASERTPAAPMPVALEITFALDDDGWAQIRWEAHILGVRQSRFMPPYGPADLPLVLRALDYLQASQGQSAFSADDMDRLEALNLARDGFLTDQAHRSVGMALFTALTVDPAGREALATVRNMATASGAPLAISLHLPPQAVGLAALPWELLWDERPEPVLIGLGRSSTLTRHLDLDSALPPPRAGGRPLRILPVLPQAGMPDAERQEERAAREQAWATLRDQGDAELLPKVSPATREALFDRLDMLDAPPDILHFVGHGKYLDGQGHLVLDRPGGGWEPTPVALLASQLRGVRLVVLVSCQSAMLAEGTGPTPAMLTGAATAISAAGVPLVLAMQLTIRKAAAYRFLEIFYRHLARGRSVQAALARARHGLYAEEGDGASWYVPVLYMRSRERGTAVMIGETAVEES